MDGFVRFLRVGFLDFFPALLTGAFALAAAVGKQPLLGLIMLGVIPTTLFLTIRQLLSQKGVRLELLRRCEEIDGAVVENMSGLEYVRAANTHALEVRRLRRTCERRRAKEIRHHFQMSLYGAAKALNEGFFHVLVLGMAIYLAVNGRVSFGDVLMFSILFLNVMAPLSEVHRVLDEGHEASLRVGDLLEMLGQPVDNSFVVKERREPKLIPGAPVITAENLTVEYLTAGRPRSWPRPARHRPEHSLRRDDRRGRPIRLRQVHLDQGVAAVDPPVSGPRLPRRGAAGVLHTRRRQPHPRLRRPAAFRVLRHHRREHRLRQREGDARGRASGGRTGLHPR